MTERRFLGGVIAPRLEAKTPTMGAPKQGAIPPHKGQGRNRHRSLYLGRIAAPDRPAAPATQAGRSRGPVAVSTLFDLPERARLGAKRSPHGDAHVSAK
jgi:hypothetical protein